MFGVPVWAIKAVCYVIMAIVVFGAGMRLMSQLDAGKIAGYKATLARQAAVVKQVTAVTDQITKADQAKEAVSQAALASQAAKSRKEIVRYVSSSPRPPVGCVTVGMLRLHDAFVLGVDPSEVVPPAASADAACSSIAPSDFMAVVHDNYTAARANAEQLDALIADVKDRTAAVAASGKPE